MNWLSKIFESSGDSNSALSRSGRHPQFLEDNTFWRAPHSSLVTDGAETVMILQGNFRVASTDLSIPLMCPPILLILQAHVVQEHIEYVLAATVKSDVENILDAWEHFSIQNAFAVALVVTPLLSMRDPYHKTCFKEVNHRKCRVCQQFIPTNAAGLIEYRCHPFWSQKYCPSHEHDNTARCCSCERLESQNTSYVALGDGRSLCLECLESAIMDTGDCQTLYHAIRDFYEGMNMRIDQQIPMLLVERQALNEAIIGEKNVFYCPFTVLFEFYGPVSHSEKYFFSRGSITCRRPGACVFLKSRPSPLRPRIGGHQLVGMRTYPQKLMRRCDVTAILVLYGLPKLLTGAILAHELMHGWLRLEGYRNLRPEVEEGICQVVSYMWLEAEVMPGFRNMPSTSTSIASSSSSSSSKKGRTSEVEKELGEFFLHQIANDASPAYGGGFRVANAAVNKYGLRSTLHHIRLTGCFPI